MTKDFSPTKQSMYITILNFLLYNLSFLKHFDESNEKNSHPINFFVTKKIMLDHSFFIRYYHILFIVVKDLCIFYIIIFFLKLKL